MSKPVKKTQFGGTEIELQNMTLVLPVLNFDAFRNHGAMKKMNMVIKALKRVEETEELDLTDDELDAAIDLVFLSAKRNYPEISKQDIAEGMDFEILGKVMPVLVTKNQLAQVQEFSAKNE